jgi:perosamine synthetase
VHIGGIIAPDFLEIVEFCKNKGLFLIEDDAHAHGSQMKGIKAGNFADGGAFSFFPTKVMTTIEGGMITTNNEEEARLVKSFRNQGKRDGAYGGLHYDLGSSWRLSEISAYMGLIQLAKLDEMLERRRRGVEALLPVLRKNNIEFVDTKHMDKASNYKFIIRYKNDEKVEALKEKFKADGVILGGGVYEVPCHLQPVFKDIPYKKQEVNVAEEFCPRHICPPITSGTTEADASVIIKVIEKYIR